MKQMWAALVVVVALTACPIAQSQTTVDIVGNWDITTVSPLGESTNAMVISKEGDDLKAMAKSPQGERPYDKIELAGSTVTLVLTIDYQGSPMIITYTGAVDGKNMSGDADFGGLAQGTWSAVRK
jgi:hypothetical protein